MQSALRQCFSSKPFQFGIFTALFMCAAFVSACSFWTESEVWSATVVKYMENNPGTYNFAIKPLTNVLLYLSFCIARILDVHPMDCARALFAANFLLLIYLCYRAVRRFSPSPSWVAWMMLLLLSNTFLLKRGSQVRTDMITSSILLGWILVSTSDAAASWSRRRKWAVFAAFTVLAAAVTPKSLIFMAGAFALQNTQGRRRYALFVAIGAFFVAAAACPGWLEEIPALRFLIASFQAGPGSPPYFDWRRLWHIHRFVMQNPVFALLWMRNLWAGFFDRPGRPQASLFLIDFANLLLFELAIYPERLPFLIASLVPFWLLPACEIPADRWWIGLKSRLTPSFQLRSAFVAAGILICSFCSWEYFLFFHHNSRPHHEYVRWLRQFEPKLSQLEVFDPAGVLPFLRVHHWFIGPGEIHNSDVVARISQHLPQVIIASDKIFLVSNELRSTITDNYFWDGAGLLILRTVLKAPSGEVVSGKELQASLRPYILDKDGNVLSEFHLELHAAQGDLDLSRFAKWRTPDGERPFDSDVKLADLNNDLIVPKGADRWKIMPLKMQTPYTYKWQELFRFDTEQ